MDMNIIKSIAIKTSALLKVFKSDHCFVVSIDRENFINIISDKNFDIDIYKCFVDDYVLFYTINKLAKKIDENDVALFKAKLQAEAELRKQK